MNPPGGGGPVEMPEKVDRATLVARYGSRFRALSGGVPSALRPPKTPVPGQPPTSAPQPAQPPSPPSSLDECWELLCKECPKDPREVVEAHWFKILKDAVPGKDSGDFTPEDWGKVKAWIAEKVADNLPF